MNKEKDQMTYIEDGKAKDTQSKWHERRCQDHKNNLRSIWDTIKGPNIHLIAVPEENQDVEQLFEEIMMENFPKLRESQKPGIQKGSHQDTS